MATLAAAHLIDDGVVSESKLDLYTFGEPRVGDRDFSFAFNKVSMTYSQLTHTNIFIKIS